MRFHETVIKVRFNEVDLFRVAWHGHYVAWMEVGRNELAGRFGLDAEQVGSAGFIAPVILLELKYLRPARFGELLKVRTTLKRMETATLEFLADIVGPDGKRCATGRVVHSLTDASGTLQYTLPSPIRERMENLLAWQEGE